MEKERWVSFGEKYIIYIVINGIIYYNSDYSGKEVTYNNNEYKE